jgi:hypothetical protein
MSELSDPTKSSANSESRAAEGRQLEGRQENGQTAGGGAHSSERPAEAVASNSAPNGPTAASEATQTSAIAIEGPGISEVDPEEIKNWNEQVKRRMRQQTRRSFLVGGAATVAGLAGWRWLQSRREDDGLPWPFRQTLQVNEELARDYFRRDRVAPDFRGKAPLQNRVNGDLGLDDSIDLGSWRLSVEGLAGRDDPLELAFHVIRKLPRVEMTTEFKCIEGWSATVQWAGARFSDFMTAYPPATLSGEPLDLRTNVEDLPPYVAMETPDGGYYVGLDVESMLHPQTLLAYEMNGAPLTQDHGAPLRLVTPLKYGVKNIKRIGTIRYGRNRPADYWAERGYDWYVGL